jgi:O-antigen ligase
MKPFKLSLFFLFLSYILFYLDIGDFTRKIKWVCIMLLFITILIYFLKKGIPKKLLTNWVIWIHLFLFNTLGIITSLYANDFTGSFITLVGLNLYFFTFHSSAYLISSIDNGIVKINKIVIVTSAILIAIAFIVNLPLTISQFHTYFYGRIRIYGIFQHPNYLGATCFVSLLACFINLKSTERYNKTYFFMLMLFLTFLILSDSRGGLYSFIIFLTTYYLIKFVKKFRKPLIRIVMFLFIISSSLVISVPVVNFINSFLGDDNLVNEFTSGRVNNWNFILNNMVLSDNINFLFGHGLSSVSYLEKIGLNTDNGYLVWLYEAGVLNLIVIISLLLYLFFVIIRNPQFNKFGIAIFCSYTAYAFFENFLMNFGHIVPFYCWLHIFMGFFEQQKK